MKKLLSIIGTISLIISGSSNLMACDNNQLTSEELSKLKAENSKIINGNKLEWIAPQEKPFNIVDNKWYVVIWRRGDENSDWKINKFKNTRLEYIKINKINDYEIGVSNNREGNRILFIFKGNKEIVRWNYDDGTYFKSVYRWSGDNKPNMIKINNNEEITN